MRRLAEIIGPAPSEEPVLFRERLRLERIRVITGLSKLRESPRKEVKVKLSKAEQGKLALWERLKKEGIPESLIAQLMQGKKETLDA